MTRQLDLDTVFRGAPPAASRSLPSWAGVRSSHLAGTGTPTSKNICSRPAGATEISILAGLPLSFLNECGVPTGMLANIPALATSRWSPTNEGDLAFEDVEALFLPAVDVRGWPAARRHDGFPQGVLAVGVLAGRQEAVHVADDGDGAAFAGLFDTNRWLLSIVSPHFAGNFPTNFTAR